MLKKQRINTLDINSYAKSTERNASYPGHDFNVYCQRKLTHRFLTNLSGVSYTSK